MTTFEVTYLIFGIFVISAGVVMITVYSMTYPWWQGHLGRMMITYAAAEVIMSALLMSAVVWHVSPHWFRIAWFVLQTVIGGTFWFQTLMIVTLHRQNHRTERSRRELVPERDQDGASAGE